MFKAMQYVVRLRADSSRFFITSAAPGYLCQIAQLEDGALPAFGDNPILYRRSAAKFLVRELRRVGFNVYKLPYWILMIRDAVRGFRARQEARRAAEAQWK